jgi:hypothetical protein
MKSAAKTEPHLESTDLAGWQEVVAKGRLGEFSMEAIIAAFLDLRPNSEPNVKHHLARYISDDMMRRLRRYTGRNHPNEGRDIVERVHFQLWQALARSTSADAQGMRKAYASRVMFRLKDAIAEEAKARRIPDATAPRGTKASQKKREDAGESSNSVVLVEISEHPDFRDDDVRDDAYVAGGPAIGHDPTLLDGVHNLDQQIDVDRFLLENVPDYKKRFAFRLFMERVPFKSKRGNSIAAALDIDESTARLWIEEIQATLKRKFGE